MNIYLPIIIVLSFFISCIDQIPINFEENNNEYLIVNAELRDNENLHSISIKINSQASSNFQADEGVNDAEVQVIENSDRKYNFTLGEKGIYNNNALKLEPGNNYTLEIKYKNIIYKSMVETLETSIPIKDLNTRISQESYNNPSGNVSSGSLVNLYVDSDLPKEGKVFIKYGIKGTYQYNEVGTQANLNPKYCFIQENIDFDNIALVENAKLNNGEVRDQLILKKVIDSRFSENYCMKVFQERISENAYNFWKLVENEYSRTGDIFEKPPGILRGNIIEENETDISVIGLFSVIAIDSMNLFIPPSKVGNPRSECRVFNNRPARCTNCLSIANSSLVRPECFQ